MNKKEKTGIFFLLISIIYISLYVISIPVFLTYDSIIYYSLYLLPKVIPLLIIGIYLFFNNNSKLDFFYKKTVILILIVAICVSIASIFINWRELTLIITDKYNWSISGWLTWNYCFLIVYFISKYIYNNTQFSFTLATLSISSGGLIYELPICYYNYQTYFHISFPLFFNTQLFSLIFLLWMFHDKKFKINLIVVFGLIIFIIGTILYGYYNTFYAYSFFNMNLYFQWLPRLSTVVLLALLPFGLNKKMPKFS